MRALPALLLSLALVALPAAAQQHAHAGGGKALVAHDAPPGGRAYVGGIASFAIVNDADHDLKPDVHQDNHIRVTLNGAVLWEASAAAGHDYDGVNTFSVVFPAPGAYEVALLGDDGQVVASHAGTVEPARNPVDAKLLLDAPAAVPALQPAAFTLQLQADGKLIDHTDALVEVREGDDLLFRTHVHTHTAPMQLDYTFPRPGTYTVRATGYQAYPTGEDAEFAPVTAQRTVEVGPPQATALPAPAPAAPAPVPDNKVVEGTTQGGPYRLVGTYDPYTVASPGAQMRLAALVLDANGTVQHVDFAATLTGPLGQVFASKSLHEYDGIYELAVKQPTPGAYTLALDAKKGGWKGHLELPYTVSPTPATSGVGDVTVSVAGPQPVAGQATTLTLAARDAAGTPYKHSELDVEVLDPAGKTLLWTKLHTHGDGLFPLTFAFPAAGDHWLRVAPSALDGLPANYLTGKAATHLAVQVAEGPGLPLPTLPTPSDAATQAAPGAGVATLLALLGVALLLRRR